MSKKQFYWHAYHAGSLCQLVDFEARRAQIEQTKPKHELPTRRQLMKPVLGQLPAEFIVAVEAYEKAWKAQEKALEEAWKVQEEAQGKAQEEAWKAWKAYEKAWKAQEEAQEKAWKKAYEKARDEIERLHALECPDCPWDGETIFPSVQK